MMDAVSSGLSDMTRSSSGLSEIGRSSSGQSSSPANDGRRAPVQSFGSWSDDESAAAPPSVGSPSPTSDHFAIIQISRARHLPPMNKDGTANVRVVVKYDGRTAGAPMTRWRTRGEETLISRVILTCAPRRRDAAPRFARVELWHAAEYSSGGAADIALGAAVLPLCGVNDGWVSMTGGKRHLWLTPEERAAGKKADGGATGSRREYVDELYESTAYRPPRAAAGDDGACSQRNPELEITVAWSSHGLAQRDDVTLRTAAPHFAFEPLAAELRPREWLVRAHSHVVPVPSDGVRPHAEGGRRGTLLLTSVRVLFVPDGDGEPGSDDAGAPPTTPRRGAIQLWLPRWDVFSFYFRLFLFRSFYFLSVQLWLPRRQRLVVVFLVATTRCVRIALIARHAATK